MIRKSKKSQIIRGEVILLEELVALCSGLVAAADVRQFAVVELSKSQREFS